MSFSYKHGQVAALISEFYQPEVREAIELQSLPEILKDVEYFIDVGANVGQYTFHAARYLRNAKLLAIEANPYVAPALTNTVENLRSSDDRGNAYEVQAIAVSDVRGTSKLYVSTIPTLSSVFPQESALTIDVPAAQLDDFYRPARTVVKIDIEGAEYRAIRSAERFLQSGTASFFVELHGWGDRTIKKYPIHVCWLFLINGYATKKIGTHYFFYRASFQKRVMSFALRCPYLVLKYFVYRLGIEEILNGLRSTLQRLGGGGLAQL